MCDQGGAGEKADDHYLTVRVTIPHVDVRRMLEKIFGDLEYICYLHKGKKTHKEHVHVLVPDTEYKKKLKDRLRGAGFEGNKTFSIKGMKNGIRHGIQYCAKEKTEPIVHGDFDEVIRTAPVWVEKEISENFESNSTKIKDWRLDYGNLISASVSHARAYKMTEKSMREVVLDMVTRKTWVPTYMLQRHGIPPVYESIYKQRLHGSAIDGSWMSYRE